MSQSLVLLLQLVGGGAALIFDFVPEVPEVDRPDAIEVEPDIPPPEVEYEDDLSLTGALEGR